MRYNIVTPASTLAVSIADAKVYCRVTHSDHDTLIQQHIESATKMIEQRANLCIAPQTWSVSLSESEVVEKIDLYKTPILGFVSINYYDSDNVLQSLTNSQGDYISFIDGRPSSLIFSEVPTVYDRDDAMKIVFLGGFDEVPYDIKEAIFMTVYRMYNHPDDPVSERFSFVDKIVRDYRSWQ